MTLRLFSFATVSALLALSRAVHGDTLLNQRPFSNGAGTPRWSQLWQDPTPNGNDLDGDAICWADFTLNTAASIDHLEWWGAGASELGFQVEFWRQDPGTIAYQPLAVFDVSPGPSSVTPEARFRVTLADLTLSYGPGALTHFALDLASPVNLAANNAANPRWFIGIIGLTQQAYVTWNWAQSEVVPGSGHTYQWVRGGYDGGGAAFRALGDGRAMVISGVPEPNAAILVLSSIAVFAVARRRVRERSNFE